MEIGICPHSVCNLDAELFSTSRGKAQLNFEVFRQACPLSGCGDNWRAHRAGCGDVDARLHIKSPDFGDL